MTPSARRLLSAASLASITACARTAETPPRVQEAGSPPPVASACGDVAGPWSPVVGGLRARLIASGSKADRSALDVVLEVENMSAEAIELPWTGYVPLGFATFRLDDAHGKDIEPDWRFGGNAPAGNVRALFRPGRTVRYDVHRGAFVPMMGKRALRIGAFWGRELPADGSKRFLRATIDTSARQADAPDSTYEGTELVRNPPTSRAFVGPLEVPPICIE